MDKDTAKIIIERYAKALAETQGDIGGIPESKLPCDKSMVKEAIKLYLNEVPEGSDTYHKLRQFYPKLASFIPDELAERSAKAEEAMMSMDMASGDFAYLDEHAKILKQIQDDTYLLEQELYEYMATISR
ncbi:hypothetical protein LLG46_07535 [bacterium]|nr:hypothetical protein [bacterium]